jgi:hypothetical protein
MGVAVKRKFFVLVQNQTSDVQFILILLSLSRYALTNHNFDGQTT